MLIIVNHEVIGLTAPITEAELLMQPITHESGADWWVIDEEHGEPFTDSSGATYLIRKRTESEIQQTPEYHAWIGNNSWYLPAIYADVRVTDGSGAEVPRLRNNGTDTVAVTAKLRWTDNTDDDSNVITLIDGVSWNIQLREATETNHDVITSHATDPLYDVFEVTFTEGVCSFNYYTTNKTAVVYMREADFAILTFPDGQGGTQDYRVALIHPVIVKVYRVLSST